jgi:hypothetical protein
LGPEQALRLGLVTVAPDDLDWEDEVRVAIEERVSLSPDALTGMEASLRFPGDETLETKVFGRLSAWQNWVFIRPNSTGEHGALKLFGTGSKARFTWERVYGAGAARLAVLSRSQTSEFKNCHHERREICLPLSEAKADGL